MNKLESLAGFVLLFSKEIKHFRTLACHTFGSYKRKPMTATTFSADGSVLVIAVETVITIWDPEKIVQVACRLLIVM